MRGPGEGKIIPERRRTRYLPPAVRAGVLEGDRKSVQFGFPEKPFELSVDVRVIEDEWNISPSAGCTLRYDSSARLDGPRAPWPMPDYALGTFLLQTGGVYAVYRNDDVLLLEFTRLPSGETGERGEMLASYRLLSNRPPPPGNSRDSLELLDAIDDALTALSLLEPMTPDAEAGVGHNNPPSDSALTAEDYEAVLATLRQLRSAATGRRLEAQDIGQAREQLRSVVQLITKWARRRLDLVEEGFYRGVGTVGATGLVATGLWIAAGGKIERVAELIAKFSGHLLGLS